MGRLLLSIQANGSDENMDSWSVQYASTLVYSLRIRLSALCRQPLCFVSLLCNVLLHVFQRALLLRILYRNADRTTTQYCLTRHKVQKSIPSKADSTMACIVFGPDYHFSPIHTGNRILDLHKPIRPRRVAFSMITARIVPREMVVSLITSFALPSSLSL